MTYDIALNARTSDNIHLGTVILPHQPEDADKIVRIRESLERDGWQGRPVIMYRAGDHDIAFSGAHRLAAAIGFDGVEVVWLPEDLTSEEYDLIDSAHDDCELLDVFVEIDQMREANGDMDDVIAAMQAEVAANHA
ncbi:hypothetical protein ACERNI_10890 [Camelimonas sp. ID_303_24]